MVNSRVPSRMFVHGDAGLVAADGTKQRNRPRSHTNVVFTSLIHKPTGDESPLQAHRVVIRRYNATADPRWRWLMRACRTASSSTGEISANVKRHHACHWSKHRAEEQKTRTRSTDRAG